MPSLSPLFGVCALLLATACSSADDGERGGNGVSVSIGDASAASATATANASASNSVKFGIEADSATGRVALSLPAGTTAGSKFDIDGVGLYPGARVGSVNVKASDGPGGSVASVRIAFTAPADAAEVADWYQHQFDLKKHAVTRRGETLSGRTRDGDDFSLALTQRAAGASQGLLTIADAG